MENHGYDIIASADFADETFSYDGLIVAALPDKAVDLVDEALSVIRMEIDSLPEELDKSKRTIMKLEIEREAFDCFRRCRPFPFPFEYRDVWGPLHHHRSTLLGPLL